MKFLLHGDDRLYNKAFRRLSRSSPHETRLWAMESLWAVQRALEAHESTSDQAALDEARRGAVGMLAAIDSLSRT